MPVNIETKIRKMAPARRRKIAARAEQLIAEEMSLRELRKAHRLTQARLAETLGVGQEQISRLEQRSDLLLSTLRSYVEAMGGKLTLTAEFPDQAPVVISGVTVLEQGAKSRIA